MTADLDHAEQHSLCVLFVTTLPDAAWLSDQTSSARQDADPAPAPEAAAGSGSAEPAVAAVETEVFLGVMRHSARVDNAEDAAQTDLDGEPRKP